ncbi:hypothetical protein ACQZ46_23735 [Agrobacterium salinitolerans]
MFPEPTSASRETVLSAVFAALERVPDVELIERNRQHEVDKEVSSAILMFDGDILGETDRPDSALRRQPTFPLTYVIEIWGGIQGGTGNPGTLINDLWRRTVQRLFTDEALIQLLVSNGIGMRVAETAFPNPRSVGSTKVAAFSMLIELPFEFDPLDP